MTLGGSVILAIAGKKPMWGAKKIGSDLPGVSVTIVVGVRGDCSPGSLGGWPEGPMDHSPGMSAAIPRDSVHKGSFLAPTGQRSRPRENLPKRTATLPRPRRGRQFLGGNPTQGFRCALNLWAEIPEPVGPSGSTNANRCLIGLKIFHPLSRGSHICQGTAGNFIAPDNKNSQPASCSCKRRNVSRIGLGDPAASNNPPCGKSCGVASLS